MRMNPSYIIFLLLAYAMFFTSCINEESEYNDDRLLIFNTVESGSQYPEDVRFILWAYVSDKDWQSSALSAQVLIDGEPVSHHDDYWRTDKEYLWPDQGMNLNFFACSPADAPVSFSLENGIVFQNYNISEHKDFKYSIPVKDMSKPDTEAAVNLVFENPLCAIEFHAYSSGDDGAEIHINNIELQGIKTVGNFRSLPVAQWSELKEGNTLDAFEGSLTLSEKTALVVDDIMIIPQKIQAVVRYSFRNSSTGEIHDREVDIPSDQFQIPLPGAKRIYTLKITQESAEILQPNR